MERGLHMSSTPIYEYHLSINLRCIAIGQTVRNLRVMILNFETRLSMRMWLCCRPEIFGTYQLVYQGIENHEIITTPWPWLRGKHYVGVFLINPQIVPGEQASYRSHKHCYLASNISITVIMDIAQGTASEDPTPIPLSDLPAFWDDTRLLLHEPFLTHFALSKAIGEETFETRGPKKEAAQANLYVAMWNERGDMVNNPILFICFGGSESNGSFTFPTCRRKPTDTGCGCVSVRREKSSNHQTSMMVVERSGGPSSTYSGFSLKMTPNPQSCAWERLIINWDAKARFLWCIRTRFIKIRGGLQFLDYQCE